jgi:hypothetical protein
VLPNSSSGTSNVSVDIAVNPADAGLVTCNAANDWAAVGVVPTDAQGQPSVTPSVPAPQNSGPARTGAKKRRVGVPPVVRTPTVPASPTAPAPPGTG